MTSSECSSKSIPPSRDKERIYISRRLTSHSSSKHLPSQVTDQWRRSFHPHSSAKADQTGLFQFINETEPKSPISLIQMDFNMRAYPGVHPTRRRSPSCHLAENLPRKHKYSAYCSFFLVARLGLIHPTRLATEAKKSPS